MRNIRAIIFDFDGLILDTETPEYRSFAELFREHGAELGRETWGKWIGKDASGFNVYDHLDACVGRTLDREAVRSRRRAKYEALIASEQARPGVEDYLRDAKRLGLRIGLASSSTREWVEGYLSKLGLLDYFDALRTRGDVAKAKPDPELYVRAMEALGVGPDEAVAFEDSPNGALAAHRAGLRCVIVPNELTRGLTFGEHTLRLESMAELPLEALLRRLEEASQ